MRARAVINASNDWNGDAAQQAVLDDYWQRLQQGTVFFRDKVLDAIGIANPYLVKRKRTRDTTRGKKGSEYSYYTRGSDPGTPPYARTGHLRASVRDEYDKPELRSRVSVDTGHKYGGYLEFGTRKMKARPFLFATLEKFKDLIALYFAD